MIVSHLEPIGRIWFHSICSITWWVKLQCDKWINASESLFLFDLKSLAALFWTNYLLTHVRLYRLLCSSNLVLCKTKRRKHKKAAGVRVSAKLCLQIMRAKLHVSSLPRSKHRSLIIKQVNTQKACVNCPCLSKQSSLTLPSLAAFFVT